MTSRSSLLRSRTARALMLSGVLACSFSEEHDKEGAAPDAGMCEPPDIVPPANARCQKEVLDFLVKPVDKADRYPLFVDSVEVVVPGCEQRIACAGGSCRIPRGAAPNHRVTLVAQLLGETYEVKVPLDFEGYPPNERNCQYVATLPLPRPACADREALAVEGRVLGAADGANLNVTLLEPYKSDGDVLHIRGRLRECAMDGNHYRCPALGYQSHYLLWVRDGERNLAQRDVRVRIDGCDIRAANYDVRVETCDVELWLLADAASSAPEVSLSFVDSPGEAALPCAFPEASRGMLRCELPTATPTARGRLTIRSSNGATLDKSVRFFGTRCPSNLLANLNMGSLLMAPDYGVPNVLLSFYEMRTLGLASEAE